MTRDVHHPVIDQRLRFFAGVVVHTVRPRRHELFDRVAIDLCERAITLVVVAHPVGEHVLRCPFRILDLVSCLQLSARGQQKERPYLGRLHILLISCNPPDARAPCRGYCRERLGSLRFEPNEDEGRGETMIGILCTHWEEGLRSYQGLCPFRMSYRRVIHLLLGTTPVLELVCVCPCRSRKFRPCGLAHEAESGHHPMRCLRSSICLGRLSPT